MSRHTVALPADGHAEASHDRAAVTTPGGIRAVGGADVAEAAITVAGSATVAMVLLRSLLPICLVC